MNPRCMNFIGSGVVFHMCVITKSSKYDPIDRQTGILLMSCLARNPQLNRLIRLTWSSSPTFFSELKELEQSMLQGIPVFEHQCV